MAQHGGISVMAAAAAASKYQWLNGGVTSYGGMRRCGVRQAAKKNARKENRHHA